MSIPHIFSFRFSQYSPSMIQAPLQQPNSATYTFTPTTSTTNIPSSLQSTMGSYRNSYRNSSISSAWTMNLPIRDRAQQNSSRGPSNPRKRSPPSRSPSPRRRRSPPAGDSRNGTRDLSVNGEPDKQDRLSMLPAEIQEMIYTELFRSYDVGVHLVDIIPPKLARQAKSSAMEINEQYDVVSDGVMCLRGIIEGRTWLMSSTGARLPPAMQSKREYDWMLQPSLFSMRQAASAFRSEPGPNARLWYWEERVGRTLLNVQIDNTTNFPSPPRRERPLEELELDPQSKIAKELEELAF